MNKCRLSNNTRDYAKRYECILDKMIDQMTCVKMTNSISAGFITQMITHHRAAIEMSKNLLCYTTNIPLQDIALNIISSQEKSIQEHSRNVRRASIIQERFAAIQMRITGSSARCSVR